MISITSREQVYTAFFAFLQANSGVAAQVKTFTRRLKHWNDVAVEDQPALYMMHSGEVAQPIARQPTKWILELTMWLYVNTNDENTPVGPIMNPVLDVIEQALQPANNDGNWQQTLNGLVHHCWIEGQTQIFEGDLGTEAVATIPVKILVT